MKCADPDCQHDADWQSLTRFSDGGEHGVATCSDHWEEACHDAASVGRVRRGGQYVTVTLIVHQETKPETP